jgi:hypothetical protein
MLAELAIAHTMAHPAAAEAYIRARLVLACEAIRRLSASGCFPGEYRVVWPDQQAEPHKDYAPDRTETRISATPEQLRALREIEEGAWLYRLADLRHRRAVFLKAYHPNAGWRRIGWLLGCSHETARTWERQGIEEIARGRL